MPSAPHKLNAPPFWDLNGRIGTERNGTDRIVLDRMEADEDMVGAVGAVRGWSGVMQLQLVFYTFFVFSFMVMHFFYSSQAHLQLQLRLWLRFIVLTIISFINNSVLYGFLEKANFSFSQSTHVLLSV